MTATYEAGGSSNKDQVRLLIFDTDIPENVIFQDEEINRFLTIQESNVLLAAAMALDVMAGRESMVQKVMTIMDLSTNGPAVAVDLRNQAKQFRMEAEIGAVDTAEFVNNVFQERERWYKQRERGVI